MAKHFPQIPASKEKATTIQVTILPYMDICQYAPLWMSVVQASESVDWMLRAHFSRRSLPAWQQWILPGSDEFSMEKWMTC